MVGGGAAQLDRQLHAGAGAELVGVQAEAEAGGPAGLEHGPALVGVEGALLAEGVDPAGVGGAGREHLAADQVDVVVGPALELGRDDVGAEEGGLVGQLPATCRQRASSTGVSP